MGRDGTESFAVRCAELTEIRAANPAAIAEAAEGRARRSSVLGQDGRLLLVAADHPARGALGAGDRPWAMADRRDLLERVCTVLARPEVDGVLGTPDVIEDLLLLGVLDGKVVIGSMNRGGLAGSAFEIDDRFTAYAAASIAEHHLDGGKMLLRIDPEDPATARTLEGCAQSVSELAARGLMAMIEPFVARREDGRVRNVPGPDAMTRAIAVASGLGATSAYTWLKVPLVDDMERVMAASTLPALLLGGDVQGRLPWRDRRRWRRALALPTVKGLVAGRNLLYPPGDDVAGAVDAAVEVLRS
jgi:uncharacterized protein